MMNMNEIYTDSRPPDSPQVLSIDLETYSSADLSKCGVYRYVEADDFEILLLAYAFDEDEVRIVDMACGESVPQEIWDAIDNPGIIKAAWNAQFERTCIGHYLGRVLSPDSWQCSMIHAASLSLPLALRNAALVLKTGEQKDRAGENLIKYFSVPCKPTKSNGGRTRNLPQHDPEGWRKFKDYCLQDVRTERDIRKRLEAFPMPEAEWNYYHMDQRINDRGVRIDTVLVQQAIACDLMLSDEMTKKAYELTGLENPNSVSQLKQWLEEKGIPMESLGKKDVAAMIAELDKNGCDQEALDMLKLRLQMAKSSVKKYQAAERYVNQDGRAKGLFQFYGANRTGRFSGRGIQLQNLPQNHMSTLDEARELVKMGCFEAVEMLYGNTPDVLSQLIRTMLVPKEGCEFIVADFSAIEARVLAWEADEQWRLDAFEKGADIYCESASQMFHVPVVKHGVNGDLRQKGKVAELACIAEGSLVLTNQGLVPIEDVMPEQKVWDGREWVTHGGVIYKGEREVIEYEGLTATPDHLVFIEGETEPVYFGIAAACGAHLIQSGYGGTAIRLGENNWSGETVEQRVEPLLCPDRVYGMRHCPMDNFGKSYKRTVQRMPVLFSAEADTAMAGQKADCCETAVREPKRSRLSQLWGKRHPIRFSGSDRSGDLSNRKIRASRQKNGDRQDRQQWELCSGQYPFCDTQAEQPQQTMYGAFPLRSGILALCTFGGYTKAVFRIDAGRDYSGCRNSCVRKTKELAVYRGKVRVYDIRNAGRCHRFTVSGRLVHNCGYGGSVGALISMGALDMGLKESELPDLIQNWREANPKIVQYWWDVEKAAAETVKTHEEHSIKRIRFQYYSGTLWMELPSGRKLAYLQPKLQPNRFGRMSLTFCGTGANNKWQRQETYSGKIVENATQAIARDILTEAMWRLEKAGFEIVGHVHDEVIIEAPLGKYTPEDICKVMAANPRWCMDLPLAAAGYRGDYYFKD